MGEIKTKIQIAQASGSDQGYSKFGLKPGDQYAPQNKLGETNVSYLTLDKEYWLELIRCKDPDIAKKAAADAVRLATENYLVGYDQTINTTANGKTGYINQKNRGRNGLFNILNSDEINWSVDKYFQSNIATEVDCASFVYTVYCIHVPKLRGWKNKIGNCAWCGNIWWKKNEVPSNEGPFKDYGDGKFDHYTNVEEINDPAKLQVGDILNSPSHHSVIIVSLDDSINPQPMVSQPDSNTIYYTGSGGSYASTGGSYIDRPTNISVATNITGVSNNVVNLSLAANYYDKNLLQQSANRKREFEALRDSMAGDASKMGMDIYLPEEIYDTNILKGSQESRTERV